MKYTIPNMDIFNIYSFNITSIIEVYFAILLLGKCSIKQLGLFSTPSGTPIGKRVHLRAYPSSPHKNIQFRL